MAECPIAFAVCHKPPFPSFFLRCFSRTVLSSSEIATSVQLDGAGRLPVGASPVLSRHNHGTPRTKLNAPHGERHLCPHVPGLTGAERGLLACETSSRTMGDREHCGGPFAWGRWVCFSGCGGGPPEPAPEVALFPRSLTWRESSGIDPPMIGGGRDTRGSAGVAVRAPPAPGRRWFGRRCRPPPAARHGSARAWVSRPP
jgi:hypothetical protein